MKIKKIMVLGSGFMGTGIAQTAAQYGYSVVLYGRSSSKLELSMSNIDGFVEKLVQKGKLSEPKAEIIDLMAALRASIEAAKKEPVLR